MVTVPDLRERVLEHLGEAVAADEQLCERCTAILNEEITDWVQLRKLAESVEAVLFDKLYALSGPGMMIRTARGENHKVYMDELSDMADDLTEILLTSLPEDRVNYELIDGYYMRTGSYAALKCLCERFATYITLTDLTLMKRMLAENDPALRWRDWRKKGAIQ